MSFKVHPNELEQVKQSAVTYFAPIALREALRRLCSVTSRDCLDEFEKAMVEVVDRTAADVPHLEEMKEFAIAELHLIIKGVHDDPHTKQPVENKSARRAEDRSEVRETLEEQLQHALEDSFPASDPPSVTSTSIPGKAEMEPA